MHAVWMQRVNTEPHNLTNEIRTGRGRRRNLTWPVGKKWFLRTVTYWRLVIWGWGTEMSRARAGCVAAWDMVAGESNEKYEKTDRSRTWRNNKGRIKRRARVTKVRSICAKRWEKRHLFCISLQHLYLPGGFFTSFWLSWEKIGPQTFSPLYSIFLFFFLSTLRGKEANSYSSFWVKVGQTKLNFKRWDDCNNNNWKLCIAFFIVSLRDFHQKLQRNRKKRIIGNEQF